MSEEQIKLNRKLYRVAVLFMLIVMVSGIVDWNEQMPVANIFIHFFFVAFLSVFLLFEPIKSYNTMKVMVIFTITCYFYTMFFLYPKSYLIIILIAIIPSIAIIFFHRVLFYTLAIFNFLFATVFFVYVFLYDHGKMYEYLYSNFWGNVVHFLGSQAIVVLSFYLTSFRLQEMQMYYEHVQYTEHLKETEQLAAAVAHEIRNPITVVSGFLQLYEEDKRIPADVQENICLMKNELDAAELIIHDFLALAKPLDEKLEKVDVRKLLLAVEELLTPYASIHKVSFSISISNPLYIHSNFTELKRMVVNIVKNAIEAMPYGGIVDITSQETKEGISIQISDAGIGMTDEEMKLLGRPFYSLSSRGTGLGLMTCFNIVERYKGNIIFKSKKGEGTTVSVLFPMY